MGKKELLCPYCGADLLANQNTIHRKISEVENFIIEDEKIWFIHASTEDSSGLLCNSCGNDLDDFLSDYEIFY